VHASQPSYYSKPNPVCKEVTSKKICACFSFLRENRLFSRQVCAIILKNIRFHNRRRISHGSNAAFPLRAEWLQPPGSSKLYRIDQVSAPRPGGAAEHPAADRPFRG